MPQQEPKTKPVIKAKPSVTGTLIKIIGERATPSKPSLKAPAKPEAMPEKKTAPAKPVTKVVTKPTPKKEAVKEAPKKAEATKAQESEDQTGFNDPEYIARNYKAYTHESSPEDSREINFRAGLYRKDEKSGDVFPTEKYNELSKTGKVKSYLKEFKRREGIVEKKIAEKSGKSDYDYRNKRNAEALKKDVVNSLKNFK